MGPIHDFPCTPGGTIAGGRNRLRLLLTGLAFAMTIFAMLIWMRGAVLPGFLALGAAGMAGLAWRMASDLELRRILLTDEELDIRLRWGRVRLPVADLRARLLTPQEIEHLERLVSVGLFSASTGGFDSQRLGEFDLYATDLQHSVLLESPPGLDADGELVREPVRAIVTPDEPDRFLAALSSSAPATIPSP